jgi:hypothetical protein
MKIQNHTFLTIFAASFLLFAASCGKKTEIALEPQATAEAPKANEATAETPAPTINQPEAEVPADNAEKPAEQANNESPCNCPCAQDKPSEESDKSDSDEENSKDEGYCDDEPPEKWLSWAGLVTFGRRHEIQGDMSEGKWADLEPKLPVPILKVSQDNDVIKNLESMFKYNCGIDDSKTTSDGTSVQLILCSKIIDDVKDKDVEGEEKIEPSRGHYYDDHGCPHDVADYAYLSLVNPKDHNTRVYKIDSNLDFGYEGSCVTEEESGSLTLSDVESRPFMDTMGVYVRTEKSHYHGVEHCCSDSTDDHDATITTWLFAGDNHRLVINWIDSSYSSHLEYDGQGPCAKYDYSAKYSETYMYYESGEFKESDSKTAQDINELVDLLLHRP